MTKSCEAWKGWESRRNFDLFSVGTDNFQAFTKLLWSEVAVVQRMLERCSSLQPGSIAARVTEDLHAEVATLSEKNRQLRATLDETTARVQCSKQKYENYKKDQKLLAQEIKETYEAFLMAKKYYKKNLKLYYCVESTEDNQQTVFVQFFTESKGGKQQYYIRLKRNIKTGRNELLEMSPMMATFKAIKNRLEETNDVPGALCCIRQSFLMVRQRK